jgi:singapore isolate B (sub-type 7) whole genome shotgun sequence assembly, scaffold_0
LIHSLISSCFYQFIGLGEDDSAETSFSSFLAPDGSVQVPVFSPRALTNLKPLDVIPSLSPLLKLHAEDLRGEGTPQLYALCGRGSRSSLRVLQQGLSITMLSQNALPYAPRGLWTLRDLHSGLDRYMVISFNNATIVLSVGETVEQVSDTGFKLDESTLLAGVMEGGSLLQVTPGGFRQIFEDGQTKIWEPPSRRSVVCATMNTRQIVVALSNGDVLYFELDERLVWIEQESMNHNEDVTCLDLPTLGENSLRAPFLAVGYGDRSCRMYSLDPRGLLEELSMLALPKMPSAIALETMHMGAAGHTTETLLLTVGTEEGVLMRVEVDDRTGKLGMARSSRFLGPRPVRLFKVMAERLPCVLALSLKPWLCYCADNTMMLTPLVCDAIDFAASFASPQCTEGIVCLSGSNLQILRLDNLSQPFASTSIPLSYTPRQMAMIPGVPRLIILETDHNAYSELEKQRFYQNVNAQYVNEYECGTPIPTEQDKWASCIRVIDAVSLQTLERLELADNEAAFSVCTCRFHDKGDESYVVIGTAKNLKIHPRSCSQGYISVFRFVEGRSLQLLHRTEVDEVPGAMCEFDGRLAVGIGRSLRVYDLGKKKLLRKCENKVNEMRPNDD